MRGHLAEQNVQRRGLQLGIASPTGSVPSSSRSTTSPASKGSRTLPPMDAMPGPKLATFDWPPPPSPANAHGHHIGGASGHGAGTSSDLRTGWTLKSSNAVGLGAASRAEVERELVKSTWRPAEIRARADLWALRADIEREKLRMVAPYPFFGCAMRFQDDFAALQITEDGRFSFSDVSVEVPDASEQGPESVVDGKERRRVVTYEGVFTTSSEPSYEEDDSQAASKDSKDQPSEKVDPEVAGIEGRSLARYEIEECGGQSRLVSVERGSYRFIFTVSPFFQPSHATVQLMLRPRSPGHPPPRCRRLPYVGTGEPVKKSNTQKRRRLFQAPRLKGSGSASVLLPSWNSALKEGPSSAFQRSAIDGDLGTSSTLICAVCMCANVPVSVSLCARC